LPELQYPVTSFIAIGIAILSFILGGIAWNRRPTLGAIPLAITLAGCGIWSLGFGVQQALVDLNPKLIAGWFIYIGILIVPATWFAFGVRFSGKGAWLQTWRAGILAVVPILTMIALLTNPIHNRFYLSTTLGHLGNYTSIVVEHGPIFWAHTVYSYILLISGTLVLLITRLQSPQVYRRQAWSLVIAALAPWILNILYLLKLFPMTGLDPTPIGFTITGLVLLLGVYRFRILDLTPLARNQIVDVMGDGVVVLDEDNRIVDCNPAASRLIGQPSASLIGRAASEVFEPWSEIARRYTNITDIQEPITVKIGAQSEFYDLRISPLFNNANRCVGRLILLRDTTAARRAQDALQESEANYRLLVDTSPDAIILTDLEGRLMLFNQVAAQVHLVTDKAKLNGISVYDYVHPDDRERARAHSHAALDTGEMQHFEYTGLTSDGQQFPAEISMSVFRDQGGRPKGFVCAVRDITARRKSEDQIRRIAQAERNQRELADALRESSAVLTETLDSETILDRLLEQVARVVAYDSANVILIRGGKGEFVRIRGYEQFGEEVASQVKFITFDLEKNTIFRWMIEHKQPLIISDTQSSTEWERFLPTSYVRSWVGAPIIVRGQVIGFFSLDKVTPDYYHPEQAQSLAAFAAQAGLALQNANLFTETRELLQRQQRLNSILQLIGSSLDQSVVLNDILRASCELINADAGVLGLMDPGGETITAANAYNLRIFDLDPTLHRGEGLAWEVVEAKKAILIEDYFAYPRAREALNNVGIYSALCAPVQAGSEILGVLTFYTTHPGKHFLERDVPLAVAIGREAGVSIQNSRLFASARHRAEEAETVREAVSAVSSALELNWVLDQIIKNLEKVVPFDSCAVFLQEGDKLRIVAARGFPDPGKVLGQSFTIDNPLTLDAFRTGKAIILADAATDPRYAGWGDSDHVHGWMGVPLFARGAITGLLTIDSRTIGAYSPADANLAQAFANQAAIAIENARLFEKVQHLAITDPLTGLYNRRHFFEMARREFYRARRYGASMALMMLDVDDLKLVNDTYGHMIGDQLVEFIGSQCRSQLRQVDIPARYAGDEFIIALPETNLEGAIQVAQRIREHSSAGFIAEGQNLVPTSVTIGVSEMDSSCFSLETLINRADQAMYAAKQAGKNRVSAWRDGVFTIHDGTSAPYDAKIKPDGETHPA